MVQYFGSVPDEFPNSREYLFLEFSPNLAIPLQQRWRNNGLSADFLADYLTVFFPNQEEKQEEVKSTVSYIANELLENAMKFHDNLSPYSVCIQIKLYADRLIFLAKNSISQKAVVPFQTHLQELMRYDPKELWVQKLINETEQNSHNHLGLGLLTILMDYETKLHWKFETPQTHPNVTIVTTQVQLNI
jgi:hypothetical protein